MARKPLFESLLQQASGNMASIVIIALGAFAIYYLSVHKAGSAPRPPRGLPSQGGGAAIGRQEPAAVKRRSDTTVLQRIKSKEFVGSKICIASDIFYKDGKWAADGKAKDILQWYAFSSDVYLMCKIESVDEQARLVETFKAIEGLQRHKILFCTTEKAYESFPRQIGPALLITNSARDAAFLSASLPFIAFVGEKSIDKPNVSCVPTVASLACDETA